VSFKEILPGFIASSFCVTNNVSTSEVPLNVKTNIYLSLKYKKLLHHFVSVFGSSFFSLSQISRVLVAVWGSSITHTHHSVEPLWTSDWPVVEASTWKHATLTSDVHTPTRFEPAIPAIERPQDPALHRAATGIGESTSG